MKRYCFYCGKVFVINPMTKLGGLKAKVFDSQKCKIKHMQEVATERILRNTK